LAVVLIGLFIAVQIVNHKLSNIAQRPFCKYNLNNILDDSSSDEENELLNID
jgi:hypothetical protein